MVKKLLIVIEIILSIVLLKLFANFLINEKFINDYEKGKYDLKIIGVLSFPNLSQSYIYHYNRGNALYQTEKYEEAIDEYYKALNSRMSEKEECSVRINLALAKLKTLDDLENEDNKEKNIAILKSARNVLTEKGCANDKDDNGHSKEAEQLKKDIDDMLKKLENEKNEEDPKEQEEQQEQQEKQENEKNETEKRKRAKEELKQIQEESTKERNEQLESSENWSSSYEYYGGKRW